MFQSLLRILLALKFLVFGDFVSHAETLVLVFSVFLCVDVVLLSFLFGLQLRQWSPTSYFVFLLYAGDFLSFEHQK